MPTADYVRPALYDKQQAAVFDPARFSLIEASTKSGKTVGCLIWLLEQAMAGRDGWNYWWIAPIFPQAKMAYRRLKRMLPRWAFVANETELTIKLKNGAVIWFKGSEHSDSLYGEDVHAAVVDEASRVKEESWHALRSTLTHTRGHVRVIGNVKGRKNWFYRMARKAAAAEPDMAYHRITAMDAVAAGVIDADEVAGARRQLPADVFRELYEAEASDDAGNPFGYEAIRKSVGKMSGAESTVFGWDLAKSVDWTAGIGLDTERRVCHLDRFQSPWEDTVTRIAEVTLKTPALVDASGVGDPIVERLQRKGMKVTGFKFTSTSKQQLMEGLAAAIQHGEVTFPAGVIVDELESYEYEYSRTGVRYTAPSGMHDDTVCALALAVMHHRAAMSRSGGMAEFL